jgi:hypothetical protein
MKAPMKRYFVPAFGGALIGFWAVAMSNSPVPFGARYVASEKDEVVYELRGGDAFERARHSAENLGYHVRNADDGSAMLQQGETMIHIRRGRFLGLPAGEILGPSAVIDASRDAVVIEVCQPEPAWCQLVSSVVRS